MTRRPFCNAHVSVRYVGVVRVTLSELQCTYPVTSRFRNVFTNLLGRETQWTDLWGESRGSTDLTSGGTEVNDLLFVGIEFWS